VSTPDGRRYPEIWPSELSKTFPGGVDFPLLLLIKLIKLINLINLMYMVSGNLIFLIYSDILDTFFFFRYGSSDCSRQLVHNHDERIR